MGSYLEDYRVPRTWTPEIRSLMTNGSIQLTASCDWRARYANLQHMLGPDQVVQNGAIYPRWIGGSANFWYERWGANGAEYRVVNAHTGKGKIAFTHAAIAASLGKHYGTTIAPSDLMLRSLAIDERLNHAQFQVFGQSWEFDGASGALHQSVLKNERDSLTSPSGRLAAFTRDNNLWIRDLHTGHERALTEDGTPAFAYAAPPYNTRYQGEYIGARPEAIWSPDSTRLLTIRTDEREVQLLPMVDVAPELGLRTAVVDNPVSLPGSQNVTEFRLFVIDVETGKRIEAHYPPVPAVRMGDTLFAAGLAWWSADGQIAYFVDVERFEKTVNVVAFNATNGSTRIILTEKSDTYIDLSVNVYAPAQVVPLPATNELVWYSERNGNGHLYLYDLTSGDLKRQITDGPWRIRDIQHIDQERRELFFTAAGIAPEEDPYICKPCIVSLDNGEIRILSDEVGEHVIWRPSEYSLIYAGFLGHDIQAISGVSPDGKYFVETVGQVDRLPRTVLRHRSGELIAVLEEADGGCLPEDWIWPEAVKLTAADGATAVYGLLFKPAGYDPKNSYPIVDYIYGGPQVSHVPKSAFTGATVAGEYRTAAAIAALGMFVLILDGRGTAYRERAFRDASFGAIHTASNLEDHIAGIKQLATRYAALDLNRVGITGFSGGGYMTAMAAVRFGDFFKVAVAGGGNYDQRLFTHTWGERYHGPYENALYEAQAVKTYAEGMTGRLMLIHGLRDAGCHPAGMFQLVQSLIDANKDVDLVILPRAGHELTGYGERRRADYFVSHLIGETPPTNVRLVTQRDILNVMLKRSADPAGPEHA